MASKSKQDMRAPTESKKVLVDLTNLVETQQKGTQTDAVKSVVEPANRILNLQRSQ